MNRNMAKLGSSKRGAGQLGTVVTALRRSRQAIVEIDGHLDEVLDWLGDPRKVLASDLPDRLRSTTRRATLAMAAISGPAGSELF